MINSRNWRAVETGPSSRYFEIEVTGEVELPSPAAAVILRPVGRTDLDPTLLSLEVIPLGQSNLTVMSWEKCGYLYLSIERPPPSHVAIDYEGEQIAHFDVERAGSSGSE